MDKKIVKFYDLEAWQKAYELVLEIYKITKLFPKEELFGMTRKYKKSGGFNSS